MCGLNDVLQNSLQAVTGHVALLVLGRLLPLQAVGNSFY